MTLFEKWKIQQIILKKTSFLDDPKNILEEKGLQRNRNNINEDNKEGLFRKKKIQAHINAT